ncbi:hypothetical protein [Pseudoxanthomonas winnipegensis]|uniref:RHS repeat-associated core domain-containing protein n=1 Tax=Pseudoxanthomonas winnipegensis TaxID=2480810 RepID=A0A4Q8L8F5_9GAMM|nr:hypothetical protein [Pseudoxanthomonas winnipegensis]TAA24545.1 hypothetical protein EA660_12540 [Pseudoxanthomonas winnipegensis]
MPKTIPVMLAVVLCAFVCEASARFVSTDPAPPDPKDSQTLNRYHYAAGNPYRYTDPNGREIRVSNPADRSRIEKMVNALAVGMYRFNQSGQLQQVQSNGDTSRFSSYYAGRLNQAIASDKTINIAIGSTYTDVHTGQSLTVNGGLTQALSGPGLSDQNVVVTGQSYTGDIQTSTGAPLTETPPDILMHELVGHAIPGAVGSDTGNAVGNENKVRIELPDADLRKMDDSHVE